MPRSIKKGPFVDLHLQKKVDAAIAQGGRVRIKTWSRRSMVIPEMVGISIYPLSFISFSHDKFIRSSI